MNLLENELKLTKKKNDQFFQKIISLEEYNLKLQKNIDLLEQEKLTIESSFQFQKIQNELAKSSLGEKINYIQNSENKFQDQIKTFLKKLNFL